MLTSQDLKALGVSFIFVSQFHCRISGDTPRIILLYQQQQQQQLALNFFDSSHRHANAAVLARQSE